MLAIRKLKSAKKNAFLSTIDVESHNIDYNPSRRQMPFDLHITIQENSPEAQIVHQVAAAEHITPEQAGQRLFVEGIKARMGEAKTPAQKLIGAFSSDEDAAAIDAAMEVVKAQRADYDRVRDFGF